MLQAEVKGKKVWRGEITISDPLSIINEIAGRYETPERVIMEYIDNSLDDADDMARFNGGTYPYPIRILVIVDKKRKKVTIKDNCRGMDFSTLSTIVHNIGESKKRMCPWLNGQFGFGVHAFRGFCREIIFQTKSKGDDHYWLTIDKKSLEVDEPKVLDEKFGSDPGTGTIVILQEFDEEHFEGLTVEVIKEEIEAHFETMLHKENLTIQVGYQGRDLEVCKPFDYSKLPGAEVKKTEEVIYKNVVHKVDIFLKVAEVPIPKKPGFFAKGRRIAYMKDDKSFLRKSKYRTAVWDHSNLTGYVEVGELVDPVITRDSFKTGKRRTLLYDAVLRWEEEIKQEIDEINRRYEDHRLGTLEDAISKALRKLAREDALRLAAELVVGGKETSLAEGGGSDSAEGLGGPVGEGTAGEVGGGSGEGDGIGPTGSDKGNMQGTGTGGPQPETGTSDYTGTKKRKYGIGIKFRNLPPDVDNRPIRSQYVEGIIQINTGHPDFRERIKKTRQGELRVNHRLISYVAAVISIHYKDQYYEKYRNQPTARTELFDEQVEFIFRLESTLVPFLKELEDIILESDNEDSE